ncbi:hypothetical protein ACTHGU_01110 [Chitinophagaceae bacterium MMS25-I14]
MLHEHEEVLYLSKDGQHLTDREGNIILNREEKDGMTYYQVAGIQSEAYEKICTEVAPRKVCVLWNREHQCRVYDEVDVCTSFELISTGYGSIS